MFCPFFLSRQKSLENFRGDLKLKNEVIRQLIIQSNTTILLQNYRTCIPYSPQTYMTTLGLTALMIHTVRTALANKNEGTKETRCALTDSEN